MYHSGGMHLFSHLPDLSLLLLGIQMLFINYKLNQNKGHQTKADKELYQMILVIKVKAILDLGQISTLSTG